MIRITEQMLRRTFWKGLYANIGRDVDMWLAPSTLRIDIQQDESGRWYWFLASVDCDGRPDIIDASFAERPTDEWGDDTPFPSRWTPTRASAESPSATFGSMAEALADANAALARWEVDVDAEGYATVLGERIHAHGTEQGRGTPGGDK